MSSSYAISPYGFDYGVFGGGSAAALPVGHLTLYLATLVREDVLLQDVWVRGEIASVTRAASGHLYFSMKDEAACLSCVMWRSAARELAFRPEPGMQLLAHGRLNVYPPRGQYQLEVDDLQPDGAGALHLALEQAKARLLEEGLLDGARKRPLPAFPRSVAVVTSLSGAAVRDVCVILRRLPYPPAIVLVPALVQGNGAEASLCQAIRLANEESGADLLIVGRGGGSAEDLWAFNSEAVARAIAASRLPVVSAVGHESDYTLADMTADVRAPTPTAAAEIVVGIRADLMERARLATAQSHYLFRSRVETARLTWEGLQRRAPLARPAELVERRRQRLDDLNERLIRARDTTLRRWQHRLALAAGKLEGVSPLATLARGFGAVTRQPEGTQVLRVEDVAEGDRVRVRLSNGAFQATVQAVELDLAETGEDRPR